MKIPNMQWSAELCLASAFILVGADVVPLPGDIERLIRNLVHQSHHSYAPPESTLSSMSASGSSGTTALPPIAEFTTNWTPRLFPPSYKAVYPPAMQPWHLGWLDDEFVGRVTGN